MKKVVLFVLCIFCVFALGSCMGRGNKIKDYTVYIPEDALDWEESAANILISKIKENHGVELEKSDKHTDKELIIGAVSLEKELQDLFDYEELSDTGFSIISNDEKYIITANNLTALENAVTYFVVELISEKLTAPKEISHICAGEERTEKDNSGKFINVSMSESVGYDVYQVPEHINSGYRYGPSFIVYEDGSIDAWFASGGSSVEQWDWIVYKHSEDGKTWSEEKCVLQPTPNSYDHYSCCDPGVIYINGYYYLGYTSTLNNNQCDNNLFVARSENPDGPFEKWNGTSWGGNDPQPIVYFSEDQALWGIGEVSFVELDGVLYIYYTVNGSDGHHTALATADATNENWPATMEYRGLALEDSTNDAIDVKYVDEYGKFIAVATDERLTEDSYLVFFESNDGFNFKVSDICKKLVYSYCHNPGISGSENGHIVKGRNTFVGYAYGKDWGVWNTRIQDITLSLSQRSDTSERVCPNLDREAQRDTRPSSSLDYIGISAQTNCVVRRSSVVKRFPISVSACTVYHDTWTDLSQYADEIRMYGYDESIIKREADSSMYFKVLGVGETMVTIEYQGHLTYVYVVIYDATSKKDEVTDFYPLICDEFVADYTLNTSYKPQIKSIVKYADGSWEMAWVASDYDISYEYDEDKISIDDNSVITVKESGTHEIKVSLGEFSYKGTVNAAIPDLSELNFSEGLGGINFVKNPNNTFLKNTDNQRLLCIATEDSDPYVYIDYSNAAIRAEDYSSVTFKYMIPVSNEYKSYTAQIFFKCSTKEFGEEISERVELKKDGRYHEITVDLSDKEYWAGDFELMRLDYFDVCEDDDMFFLESIVLNP